jgi:putative colanic acid biosynthesis glycosyltransferase
MDEIKITVVTVTYNAYDLLEKTIRSVINQTYGNIEYIIIDGDSTDNTSVLLEQYKHDIAVCVSEKDKGIYDAMNKAIQLATGEWIIFINAGDFFASDNVIKKVFSEHNVTDYDFIYGQHIWNDGLTRDVVPNRPLELMWQRICFSHQSLFSRASLMKERPYKLNYKIVSDYENYFHHYSNGKKFMSVDVPVSVFLAGGTSHINFFKRTYERWSVVRKYKKDEKLWHVYYLKLIAVHYYNVLKRKINE